jgi:hypothetical protein
MLAITVYQVMVLALHFLDAVNPRFCLFISPQRDFVVYDPSWFYHVSAKFQPSVSQRLC